MGKRFNNSGFKISHTHERWIDPRIERYRAKTKSLGTGHVHNQECHRCGYFPVNRGLPSKTGLKPICMQCAGFK